MTKVEADYKRPSDVCEILKYPEKEGLLRKKSMLTTPEEVERLNLVEHIKKALKYAWTPGLGLAAIQIGIPLRMAWYNLQSKDGLIERTLINPEIIERNGLYIFPGEGCLSIPDKRFTVDRFLHIVVKNGKEKFEATGLEAVMIQHEIDHMDGILSFDRGHRNADKVGRNEPCPCGSGEKFKKCCIDKGVIK